MAKVGEVIQRVQSIYSKGLQSNDTRLTSRHIYSALLSARSILIKQMYNKNQKISNWVYQDLPCIELIKANYSECHCTNKKFTVLRSAFKIPKLITGIDGHLFKSVTSINGDIRFDESDFENEKYSSGNKYTADKPGFLIKNEYLFVTVLKALRVITGTGLFHDPYEVLMFPSVCDTECEECEPCVDIMETEFRIDPDLIKPLVQIAHEELIILMKQMTEDKSNNATDDTSATGKMVH